MNSSVKGVSNETSARNKCNQITVFHDCKKLWITNQAIENWFNLIKHKLWGNQVGWPIYENFLLKPSNSFVVIITLFESWSYNQIITGLGYNPEYSVSPRNNFPWDNFMGKDWFWRRKSVYKWSMCGSGTSLVKPIDGSEFGREIVGNGGWCRHHHVNTWGQPSLFEFIVNDSCYGMWEY